MRDCRDWKTQVRETGDLILILAAIGFAFYLLIFTYGCAPAPHSEIAAESPGG